MGVLSKLFGAGGASVLDGTTGILKAVDELSTSAEERASYRSQVIGTIVDAQARAIVAENEHGGWLTRSWRPLLMLGFGAAVIYNYFLGPLLRQPGVPLPPEFWVLLQLAITGYVGGRTVEKVVREFRDPKLEKMRLKHGESD